MVCGQVASGHVACGHVACGHVAFGHVPCGEPKLALGRKRGNVLEVEKFSLFPGNSEW